MSMDNPEATAPEPVEPTEPAEPSAEELEGDEAAAPEGEDAPPEPEEEV